MGSLLIRSISGEGIYDTVSWKWFGEGSVNAGEGFFTDGTEKEYTARDFRFTYRQGYLYAFQMRPDGKTVNISTLREKWLNDFGIEDVSIPGCSVKPVYRRTEQGLQIELPEGVDCRLPVGFKITIA